MLEYEKIFGGVVAFSKSNFEAVNGYSNRFWGWGGEDDDLYMRVDNMRYQIQRYSKYIARYKIGVINDPLSQHTVPLAVIFRLILKKLDGLMDAMCEISDYNQTWQWSALWINKCYWSIRLRLDGWIIAVMTTILSRYTFIGTKWLDTRIKSLILWDMLYWKIPLNTFAQTDSTVWSWYLSFSANIWRNWKTFFKFKVPSWKQGFP